jgi:HSP20 family protein
MKAAAMGAAHCLFRHIQDQEEVTMAFPASNLAVRQESRPAPASATRRTPSAWQPFESLRGDIEQIFDQFTRGFGVPMMGRRQLDLEPSWRVQTSSDLSPPAIDVVEKEKEYQIAAELPGLDEKDVEISVADDVLTISGEKKEEKEETADNYYLSERRYGSFQRSFQLPAGVDSDKIAATFQKGVLTVTVPKAPEAQHKTKKIAVKAK